MITESGQTIGFNPAGPLDGAIRDLGARALATGHDQLQRLGIDKDADSYIGLSGDVSLDVHAVPGVDGTTWLEPVTDEQYRAANEQ